ncbi:CwfJ C-terminus 1-domain-containing protein-like protein [Gorgonomyces haynaldii]|nr:CwfJ C-terminus 1-domain-containing protein-like protein [Gorgonomyces haynaldii]
MHEKNQFDLCLVVGPVDVDLAQVPLSVYFIGGSTPFEGRMLNSLAKEEQYLGTHGVLTTPEGLRIGYLSGVYDENHYKLPDTPDWFLKHSNYYNQEHIHILEKQDPVDILLTHEWPSHIAESQQVKGQMGPSIVCAKIRPRYHFSFGSFYEREPFWNTTHCTRFISLNQFGKKDRWFYAFNIDPMASMDPDALKQKPPKTTQSPFGDLIEEETNDFFFHSEKKLKKPKSNSDSDIVCRACGGRGHTARKCPESGQNPHALALKRRDPNQCWFCLSNPDVESHLIVSVIQETYLTAAKGGLVNRHTILVPVTHYPSTRALQVMEKEADKANQVLNEIERVRGTIDAIERSNGCFLVSFEIFIGLDPLKPQTRLHHMHIQVSELMVASIAWRRV